MSDRSHETRRTRDSTRWCPTLVALLIAMLVAVPTSAQILDLDTVAPFPETPTSVLDEIADRMVADLTPADLETDTGVVRAADAALRRVVAELANRGRGTDPGDAAAALAALRLSASVDGIASRLARLAVPGSFTGRPPRRLDDAARVQLPLAALDAAGDP